MEISKHGKNLNLSAPHLRLPAGNPQAGEAKGVETKQTEQIQSQRLLDRLNGDTEVRDRLLVEVQAKYLAGEYATRAAIENAAGQILGL